MTSMEPLPETVEAINELDPSVGDADLLPGLVRSANQAKELVPDLVGVSIARVQQGLTFTLVATAAEVALLDAVEYAAGGPRADAPLSNRVREFDGGDVLDEERWRLSAEATAAPAVRSTLTLPVVRGGQVVGTVNLYAGSRRAFHGRREELAAVFGAWAGGAVANADLSFATRNEARRAPQRVRDQVTVEVAVGILAAQLGVEVEDAAGRMHDAAERAGISVVQLARDIVRARHPDDGGDH